MIQGKRYTSNLFPEHTKYLYDRKEICVAVLIPIPILLMHAISVRVILVLTLFDFQFLYHL